VRVTGDDACRRLGRRFALQQREHAVKERAQEFAADRFIEDVRDADEVGILLPFPLFTSRVNDCRTIRCEAD
jgi:hypothetical protein